MMAYVVVSGEFTPNADEGNFNIIGAFEEEEDAIKHMRYLKDESLAEIAGEYVEFENDRQVIIRLEGIDNYRYEIGIKRLDIISKKMKVDDFIIK